MNKTITIISFLILFLTFFLGDNILENFKSAKLAYSTTKFQIKNEVNLEDQEELLYRQISIKNIGSKPSIDLNTLIILDGNINHFEVFSIEQYEIVESDQNKFSFRMPRLTKGAEIIIELWMESGKNDFKINATDSKQAIDFIDIDHNKTGWNIFQLISLLLLIPLSLYIFYTFKYKPLKDKNNELSVLNDDLLDKNTILKDEKHELELKIEETEQEENKNSISEDLLRFLSRYEKK